MDDTNNEGPRLGHTINLYNMFHSLSVIFFRSRLEIYLFASIFFCISLIIPMILLTPYILRTA